MEVSKEVVKQENEQSLPEIHNKLGTLAVETPHDVIEKATSISRELSSIINKQKLFVVISNVKHVKVEGWSTLGAMLGILPKVKEPVREISDGVFEATVELVRVSDGMVIGQGVAECGSDDEKDKKGNPIWASRPRFSRKSMAITRATGKAFRLGFSWIMTLAGYDATPYEEMPYQNIPNGDSNIDKEAEEKEKREVIQKIESALVDMVTNEAPQNATQDEKNKMYKEKLAEYSTWKGTYAYSKKDLAGFSIKRLQTIYGKIKKALEE